MYCKNCGNKIDDDSKFCPNCGQKIEQRVEEVTEQITESRPVDDTNNQQDIQQNSAVESLMKRSEGSSKNSYNNNTKQDKKSGKTPFYFKGWFIVLMLILLPPVGIALMWIGKRFNIVVRIILTVIFGLLFLSQVSTMLKNKDGKQDTVAVETQAETKKETKKEVKKETETVKETEAPTAPKPTEPEEVFYIDLENNGKAYNGKLVKVSVPVEYCSGDDIRVKQVGEKRISIEIDGEDLEDAKFATVQGTVKADDYEIELDDAVLLYLGDDEPKDYTKYMTEYVETVKASKIAAREDFINNAQEVTYEELRRYPDTYKDKPLKIKISVEEVEADGWISNGTVHASLEGKDLAVYDDREYREPRLMEGDSLVIYANGAGLSKVTTYVKGSGLFGSDLGADVVDETEIPAVRMVYTELDNVDAFGAVESTDDSEAYQKGKEAAEKINEMLAD